MKGRVRGCGALWVVGLLAMLLGGCGEPGRVPHRAAVDALGASEEGMFEVPGAIDRPFFLRLPEGADDADEDAPLPVVIGLHAGGGRPETFRSLTCPDGNTGHEDCLTAVFDHEDAVVVFPSGTGALFLGDLRTWNAGGDADGDLRCTTGRACEEDVDDVAYIDDVLDEVRRAVFVDPARIFVAGYSNGAAMAHRLACERSTVFAAVAAVAGGNQLAATEGCFPARPVPVLQIHGDADPCWGMDGSSAEGCLRDEDRRPLVSITESVEGWRQRNGCSTDVVEDVVNDDTGNDGDTDDGTRTVRQRFQGCVDGGDTELLLVQGGGHTWPGGHQYAGVDAIGPTARDFLASTVIRDFFAAHPLPAVFLPGAP
jgi:polyhydroxybutyrate depolymerase